MKRRELLGTLGAGAVILTTGRVEGAAAERIGPDELTDALRLEGAGSARPLAEVAPKLAQILKRSVILTPARYAASEIKLETVMVTMRDGIRLATDLYLPPKLPAPAIAVRTPYDKGEDRYTGAFMSFARRGYVVISQDCRGTGGSEPNSWDYYVREPEDGYDTVEWITKQPWFDGFLGSAGGSYVGQTQWQMAMHPKMTTTVPEVSGLGVAVNTVHLHMFANAYAKSVGHGEDKVDVPYFELEGRMVKETLSTGYFNAPLHKPFSEKILSQFPNLATMTPSGAKRWLWEHYCSLGNAARAQFIKDATGAKAITINEVESLSELFPFQISHDRHTLPAVRMDELVEELHAPPLLRTGWYDWGLNDALATWELMMRSAPEPIRSRTRLFIAPSAHNMPGYHEGMAEHPELHHAYGFPTNFEAQFQWYEAVRNGKVAEWPTVIYYLLGANEWQAADAWPLREAQPVPFYLAPGGRLATSAPRAGPPDRYVYDPEDPTPTVGGSIVSYVYPPGSVDVSKVQRRKDVLTYSTPPLEHDVDVVGPLKMVLYASSSAVDTDFAARLSDVGPDGRAIQLQNGVLRARYRDLQGDPALLEPGKVYQLEIDMWATANRFKAGHRIRVDISSADFPRFDRNTNRGGAAGPPIAATQTIYHDPSRPSHILLPVVGTPAGDAVRPGAARS
jgi:predicted acyl esterase